ncbi:MAG: MFS transporter [Chloroflexota bacterium]|nr:MFS transporter [Chloroflexota bacterium]MDE2886203.1 MFS transporter [Chloroflexota bacterium]
MPPDEQGGQALSSAARPATGIRRWAERNDTLVSLLVPAFLLGMGRGFIVPVLPLLAIDFGAGATGAGLLIFVPMVGGVIVSLPTGYLMDRIGRRSLLIASTLLLSLSALLVLRASSFNEILVYMGINGLAQQMWQMTRLTVIADSSAQNRRGRMITGMAGVNRAGTLLGPLAGGAIALLDLRIPFLLFGIFALLATVPSYLFVRETAPAVLARRRGEAAAAAVDVSWARLITRPVLVLFAAQFMANVGRGGVQGQGGIYVAYAAFAYGLNSLALGGVSSAMGVVGIPVTLMAGQVMDRFGRKRTIVPASALLAVGLGIMGGVAWGELGLPFFIFGFVVINLAVSFMAGSMQTLGSDVAPAAARGKFFGVNRLIAEAGSASNPGIFTLSVAIIAGAGGFTVAFLSMGGFAVAASLLIGLVLRETLRRE